MIQHILVPLDGSEMADQVVPHTRLLATLFGARVTFLRVTADDPARADLGPGPDYLGAAAEDLASRGIKTDTLIAQGQPAEAILETAGRQSADLIAMCTHGHGGLRRFMLGSVAANLIGNTSMPLLLVRGKPVPAEDAPTQIVEYRRILVPLDGSALAASVLPLVVDIAAKTGAVIVLLRVMPEPAAEAETSNSIQILRSITGVEPESADGRTADPYLTQLEREREGAQSSLDLAAAELQRKGVRVETLVEFGPAAEMILRAAAAQPADLVAMGTHGRTGLQRFLLGSVADRVVRYSEAPVLLMPNLAAART